MANSNLTNAKIAKNDEFYTQYSDIEKEVSAYLEYDSEVFRGKTVLLPCDDPEWSNFTRYFAQNFERFGLKKLISTSYATNSKQYSSNYQATLFEINDPQYDEERTVTNGKIFTLTTDKTKDGKIDISDLEWHYLDGDGDFRSDEIKNLRDQADIIITNPPFSLFRDFLAWIVEADKQFMIIGNMNAITYKDVFSLIKEDKIWLGATGNGSDMVFAVPEGAEIAEKDRQKAARLGYAGHYTRLGIYADGKRDVAVIESILNGYPLGLVYFNKPSDDKLEVLDGQQRITSFGRFVTNKFAIKDDNGMEQYFGGIAEDKQQKILNTKLLIYICEGTETEIKEWFKTINIAGVPLNSQELLNAVYSGVFVTLAKAEFSNSNNANIQKWSTYINGSANRQDFLEKALEWVSKGGISEYMSFHRKDLDIVELKIHFSSVIDWVSSVFTDVETEMRGLEWGRLYEIYHHKPYDPKNVSELVKELYSDPYIKNRKGVFEYILGGSTDPKLLNVRVFDEATKKTIYSKQTNDTKANGVSNCPLCAIGHDANKSKLWALSDMDADHVAAWSKGGATDARNCQMLCKTHNRAKGNK